MIQILEENDFFIVLLKPAGTSVHNEKPSVSDYLTTNKLPVHFINRLDRETSGLMVIGKSPSTHESLSESLSGGTKMYRALLRGPWKSTAETAWVWPLTDKSEGTKNPQGITKDRVPCESKVKLIRTNAYFSEVSMQLMTGRQHQIRKHAALARQPIVGDNRYNEKKYNLTITDRYKTDRLWLHAESLEFTFQNKKYTFKNQIKLDQFFQKS